MIPTPMANSSRLIKVGQGLAQRFFQLILNRFNSVLLRVLPDFQPGLSDAYHALQLRDSRL